MNDIKKLKKMMGITMIALVVIIIIMIILASIVLTMALGDNGLIKRAKNATEIYKQAQVNEQIELNNLYSELASVTSSGINVEEMNSIVSQIVTEEILKRYPVGSIYTSTEETNPSEFIGGTWESYGEGRTLVGVGTGTDANNETRTFAANSTAGEYNHTLNTDEMPSHTHTRGTMNITGSYRFMPFCADGYGPCDRVGGAFTRELNDRNVGKGYATTANGGTYYAYSITFNASNAWTGETSAVGSSLEHNNIQPYITVYMWKRVS